MNFEGDLKLFCTADGGAVEVEDGDFVCDKTFATAVYLSLFGGNIDDAGNSDESKGWWGNIGAGESDKMRSRLQNIVVSLPLTTKNLQTARDAAEQDLRWMIDDGAADEIGVSASIIDQKTALLTVEAKKLGATVEKCAFKAQWGAMSA